MKLLFYLLAFLLTRTAVARDRWSGVVELNYFIEKNTSYFIPIVAAENEHIYFETRYNYEDFNTGSLFIGKRFSLSNTYQIDVIPIIGGTAGQTPGIVPGFEIEATFGKVGVYSQHEYLFDSGDSEGNFYYSWSDVTFSVSDSIDVGISYQRFRPVEQGTDVDAGALVGYGWEEWWGAFYYYAVETTERFMIVTLTRDF